MTSRQTDPTPDDELDALLQELPGLLASSDDIPELPVEQLMEPKTGHGRFERPSSAPSAGKSPDEANAAAEPDVDAEDDEDDDPPRKPHPVLRRLLAVFLALAALFSLVALAADQWLRFHHDRGQAQLTADYSDVKLELPKQDEAAEDEARVITFDDGKTVNYNGHTYRLNENLSTVLFMGIDRPDIDEVDDIGSGGQADVILLIALDTTTGEMNILNLPRDTYAEIVLYSGQGSWIGYEYHQLCLAYAYGNGRETSCENTIGTVSRLLYGMPISKYIAVDMDGVLVANEAVGGVTLTSLEDIKMPDGSYVRQGDEITLHGKNCERYIRTREHDVDANAARIERQKQYIRAFASTLTQQARKDFSVISHLYQDITPYIVSDLDSSDVIFLAQTYLSYGLDFSIVSYEGTYDWLENSRGTRNAVYYADEDSLFEAVLAVFYTQVD